MLPKKIIKNVFTVGGLTAVSRVLGLVREMLQSRMIGAGMEQSAFVLAFAIPNMARKLFGEGALTAAFVPVFKGELERGEVESAKRLARAVMTMVMMGLGAIVILALIGLGAYSMLSSNLSERALLTIKLIKILLPYMLFICGAAFGMGILNALGRFTEGAAMPAMLNIFWIVALGGITFFPSLAIATRTTIICIAILGGGAMQMAFLFYCMAKKGFSPLPSFAGLLSDKARLVWKNTFIGAMGAGAVQINYMLDQVLAYLASAWAAGVIGYAERLMDLPLGVIGVAFGTVLLPTFAGYFAKGDIEGAREALCASVEKLMFIMLPAAAGLFILATEITSVIYEGSAFDSIATLRVSRALAVYALGLAFFGYQKAIIPFFQAQHDMTTPLKVSVKMVVLNAILNILAITLLPEEWRHVGLASSTVICAAIGAILLTRLATAKNGSLGLKRTLKPIGKSLIGTIAMAIGLVAFKPWVGGLNLIVALGLEIALGMAIYGAIAYLLRTR